VGQRERENREEEDRAEGAGVGENLAKFFRHDLPFSTISLNLIMCSDSKQLVYLIEYNCTLNLYI
jgi:hypothetical protein